MVQITPNETTTNSLKLTDLDLKVAQLVKQFADKPLLIEKLALVQSQGLLLSLSNGKQQIEIQLPTKIAKLFENIAQNTTKLSLTTIDQQNIRLKLLTPLLKTTLSKQDASKTNSLTINNQHADKQLIFQKAILSPEGILKLNNPKAQTLTTTNPASSVDKPISANKLNRVYNQNKAGELTIAQVAKNILKSHFTKQLPISIHLDNIVKLTKDLVKIELPHPTIAKLNKHFTQLFSNIEKPSNYSAAEIKQKLNDSGHFLEKNLSKMVQANSELKPGQTLLTNPLIKQTPQPTTQKNILEQTNDTKLVLLKIKTTLESLIKTIETPQTSDSKISDSQRLLLEQLAQSLAPKQNQNQQNHQTIAQIKNQILNLQQMALKQTSEMLTEAKNMISQIESNQLLSLKNETPNLHQFLIDLPIKNNSHIDSFEMLFEHSDTTKDKQKVKRWKVVVRFDLEPLGPMFAQIELENEKISTHFFAKAQQTAALINQHLHVLKQSLFSAGVDVEKLQGSQGKIPETLLRNSEQLVDTHV